MLKTQSMIKTRAYFHEQYIDNVILEIAKAGMLHQTEVLTSLKGYEPRVKPIEPSERLFKVTSIISRLQSVFSGLKLDLPRTSGNNLKVLGDAEIDEIDRGLLEVEQSYSAIASEPTKPGPETKVKIEQQLSELSNNCKGKLLAWRQCLDITRVVEEAKSKCARTAKTIAISGWIPTEKKVEFEEALKKGSDGYCATSYLPPSKGDSHHHEEVESSFQLGEPGTAIEPIEEKFEPPPTLTRNPKITFVYEKIVTGFGLPNYFEVDPTVFMFISFPIIFGLMFGDVGHGAIFLILSLLLYVVNRKGIKTSELFEYMIKGSPLLIMCSIAAIFFGFLYGELFGSPEYYHVLEGFIHGATGVIISEVVRSASHSIETFLSGVAGFSVPVPFPFSPFEKPMLLLLVSLYVAIIQITFGLVLGLINQIRKGDYREAIIGPGLWLWFYLSCAYLFLRFKSGLFTVALQRADILGIYIALPAIVMVLARTGLHGMDGFGHALESLISSLSNSISYARILALALTHGAFSKILLMFLGLGSALAIVGVVMWGMFTFLLILCFEGLLSFIQTLRLHWVEWFLKFYTGDGYAYEPLRFS